MSFARFRTLPNGNNWKHSRLTGDVVRPAVWRLSLNQWYPEVMHLGDEEFLAAQFPQPKFLVPIEWA
jgi:hypothetical protein